MLCFSVLDLNAFERQNKAEGLGMVTEEGSGKLHYVSTLNNNIDLFLINGNSSRKESLLSLSLGVVALTPKLKN